MLTNDYGPWFQPNEALINTGLDDEGLPVFVDKGPENGLGVSVYGMGVTVGDIDGDMKRDYFVSSLGEDALLRQGSDGKWADVTAEWHAGTTSGDGERRTKWGLRFADLDQDGLVDVTVCAGTDGLRSEFRSQVSLLFCKIPMGRFRM